ncbi:hydantoinase/oxoprolinase family protein [Sediminitomix flava]|uniref:N-methylhydantoinase A/oxoprolinase/acetone carboxylase beta subunit n=1 Tax=Sediminitomix flava TaxID=379075 RepID=A0A315ZDX0_SEDFL|nr:hydantoinase/oxoprolinase family protein [Sediminitomix flava]PWJ43816.1 N-methylhydantoinase A/oxoprolinase/acetone carboxylase beta subunit [Sediminitomix flava]
MTDKSIDKLIKDIEREGEQGLLAQEKGTRKIKIGIDVGGTFTHAVAIDIAQLEVVGKACVPTTHTAREGVAKGVVDSMYQLLDLTGIHPDEVVLIAHSTTQATNALLEGDVAKVGIIGMGTGLEGRRAKSETNLKKIQLAPGKFLRTEFAFIDTKHEPTENQIREVIEELDEKGVDVIVASEAFGVDNPKNEQLVVKVAEEMGFMATAASNISKLYGLRVRTRTAVINASMMPKMLETANMTEASIRKAGMKVPLMVMRSDGGIMDINEMRRRPILTMLSGPAAGVAAALMYARISDGIFIEVGGTSSDISVIKNGKPQVKSAQIGGQRLYLQTLDVRTLGIGGGSVPRFDGERITDVGPRSAHIAGLNYTAFCNSDDFDQIELHKTQPKEGDPDNYLKIVKTDSPDKDAYTMTPTGASYYMGLVNEVGHGGANMKSLNKGMNSLAKALGQEPEKVAEDILNISASKLKPVIHQLSREYKLDSQMIQFVGGGGGASAIVPYTGKYMDVPHSIAKNAEVISAIGAALGMIRDTVERNVINPTDQDIVEVRQEALASVIAMGAASETVEVSIEVDNKNKKIIAIAMGASELRTKDVQVDCKTDQELKEICGHSLKVDPSLVESFGRSESLFAMGYTKKESRFFGLSKSEKTFLRVVDQEGTIRLQLKDCAVKGCKVNEVRTELINMLQTLTAFGDAGGLVPDIYVLIGGKIVDLTGLIQESQIMTLLELETTKLAGSDSAVVIAQVKK